MKIQIDIDDFYLDGDEIEASLKDYILKQSVQQITKSIEKKIDDQIERQVKLLIEKSLSNLIVKSADEFINSGQLKSRNNSSQMVSIQKYIEQEFEYNSGWNSIKSKIEQIAKQFAEDLKKRNDLLFASQIVARLSDNGLLKSDAAKMLLETVEKK